MPLECTFSSGVSIQKPKIVEIDKMSEIKDAIYRIEADLDSSDSDLDGFNLLWKGQDRLLG